MTVPHATDLLEAWDAGTRRSSAIRALLLLGTVHERGIDELAAMPLGWVAAELLRLRAALFGPVLACLADCHGCGTVVEIEVDIAQLTSLDTGRALEDRATPFVVSDAGVEVEFRLPTSADLMALDGEVAPAARRLARAIVIRATHHGLDVPVADLPAPLRAALERGVAEHDPLAHLELQMTCPQCGATWAEWLRVSEFVWSEVSHLAERLLGDVARLASAFGWREADILAMSASRRQHYLALLPS
jgi:hypothetical protein